MLIPFWFLQVPYTVEQIVTQDVPYHVDQGFPFSTLIPSSAKLLACFNITPCPSIRSWKRLLSVKFRNHTRSTFLYLLKSRSHIPLKRSSTGFILHSSRPLRSLMATSTIMICLFIRPLPYPVQKVSFIRSFASSSLLGGPSWVSSSSVFCFAGGRMTCWSFLRCSSPVRGDCSGAARGYSLRRNSRPGGTTCRKRVLSYCLSFVINVLVSNTVPHQRKTSATGR